MSMSSQPEPERFETLEDVEQASYVWDVSRENTSVRRAFESIFRAQRVVLQSPS